MLPLNKGISQCPIRLRGLQIFLTRQIDPLHLSSGPKEATLCQHTPMSQVSSTFDQGAEIVQPSIPAQRFLGHSALEIHTYTSEIPGHLEHVQDSLNTIISHKGIVFLYIIMKSPLTKWLFIVTYLQKMF